MHYERDLLTEGLSMCLVMTNPVDILAVRHVKQGIEAGGFRTGQPSMYYYSFKPNTAQGLQVNISN